LLKSLDLAGFKSFARPTHLEFPPGITAIVGPNGSGKSNVVDAVRWCLGEQSSRELRGTRAEDVIYAGCKRTLGVADVSMLLADTTGDDIEIGRRLFRSGESEYLVNRGRVRLRDVVIALAGVGIDAGRHVVVNQGMADALLSAGPQERRGLLEQAAGLSRYREQRDEARRKIGATQSSIETIQLVMAELEPRLALLRRQAKAVSERKEVADRLTDMLRRWYASRWASAVDSIRRARQEEARAHEELRRARSNLTEVETKLEELLEEERRLVKQRESAVAVLHQSERECDELRRNRDVLELRIADLNGRIEATRSREAVLEASIERARADHEDAQTALQTVEHEIKRWVERRETSHLFVLDLQDASSRAADAAVSAGNRLGQAAKRVRGAADAHRGAVHAFASRAADRERLADQLTVIEARQGALNSELTEISDRLRTLETGATDSERRVAELQQDRAGCVSRLRRVATALRRLEAQVGRSRGTIEAARSRQQAAADSVDSGLLQSIKVPPGWEKAIAAALGELARPGMLECAEPDLAEVRRWRDSLGLGGEWAEELVEGGPPGLFTATLLVESDDEARAAWVEVADRPAHLVGSPPLQIIARNGLVCDARGTRLSDEPAGAEEYLRAVSEIEHRESRLTCLERRMELLHAHERRGTARLEEIERELRGAEQVLRRARELVSEMNGTKHGLVRRVSEAADEAETVRTALERADAEVANWARRAADAEQAAQTLAEEEAKLRAVYDDARQAAESTRDRLERAKREHDSLCQALAIAEERRLNRQAVRDVAGEKLSRLEAELEEIAGSIPALEIQVQRARSENERLAAEAPVIGARIREQRTRLEELPKTVNAERPDPRELRDQVLEAASRVERASARLERREDDAARLRAELRLDLAVEPDELPPPGDDAPEEAEIRRLKSRVAGQSMLDEAVVAEYDELNERHTYLRHHLDDLDQALGELNEILAVSDREMESRFATAFAAVDVEFGRVFEIMLRGGMGRLVQADDGGVDVVAELPGKRSRSTTAYSGGERALVATALLFAVLKIRPTPFCVLDEVDAALDESNVDRYLAVLRDISRSTQTIVVTHNRATMAAAAVLYGMTLDGEGATNVLSLNLQTYSAS